VHIVVGYPPGGVTDIQLQAKIAFPRSGAWQRKISAGTVWTWFCCAARHSFHFSRMIEEQTEAAGSY
jgi:hypothetical protein